MIAFAVAVTKDEEYEQFAKPGIERSKEPDSELVILSATNSLFRSYNTLLAEARKLDDLEALVLLHQDTELVDDDFCGKIRAALATPRWRSSAARARSTFAASPTGRARSPGARSSTATRSTAAARSRRSAGTSRRPPTTCETGEVDSIDGFAMAFSPWAVQELEFDESLGQDPRLRPRHLPAGARQGQEGRHLRLPRRSPPLARADPRHRGLDPGAHDPQPQVGGKLPGHRARLRSGRAGLGTAGPACGGGGRRWPESRPARRDTSATPRSGRSAATSTGTSEA